MRVSLNMMAAVLLALTVAAGCRGLEPVKPEPPALTLTRDQEIRITQEAAAAFENAGGGLYPDEAVQAYVAEIGARLAAAIPENHQGDFPFTFRVLNSSAVNAFAMPGGHIYVTRGLLEKLDSEDELAAVVAHQMAHATMGHFDGRLNDLMLCDTGLGADAPAVAVAEQYSGPVTLPDGAVLAINLQQFRFSPEDESTADTIAMQYLGRTNLYNPRAVMEARGLLDSLKGPVVAEMRPWRYTHPAMPGGKERLLDMLKTKYPEYESAAKGFAPLDEAVAKMKKAGKCFETFAGAESQRGLGERMTRGGFPKNGAERLAHAVSLYGKAISEAKESGLEPAPFYAGRALAKHGLFASTGEKKDLADARADFDDAKRIDEQNFAARLFRGYFFLTVDKFYGKAEEELLEAARLNSGGKYGPLAYLCLAELYETAAFDGHDGGKAAHYYEVYLAFDPMGADAAKAAERLKALKPDSALLKLMER